MALLVLAVVELAGAALLLAACLRLPSVTAFGLAVYVLASAIVIGLTEVLSLASLVRPAGYLVGETVLLAGAVALWSRLGRPRPSLPRLDWLRLRHHPVLVFLLAVVGGALAYQLFLVLATPPDNWDSMSYHLSRAAAWYQQHRVGYIANVHNPNENGLQPNAEIEILYTFAFLARDTLAAVPQFLAELATLGAVFGMSRRLGAGRAAALFATLLTATLTEVALQAVTTQNDLLVASFVAVAAFFALGRSEAEVALAGAAIGLAIGTKLTAVFALPVLALVLLVTLPRRRLLEAGVYAVLGFALLGFYGYGLNVANTGSPIYDPATGPGVVRPQLSVDGTVSSIARVLYRFGDLSGYHPPAGLLTSLGNAGEHVFSALRIPPNPPGTTLTAFSFVPNAFAEESLSFFGPLGLLLLLPLAVFFLVTWDPRRPRPARGALALSLLVYIVGIALTNRYNVWLGRYLLAPVALTMPLCAVLYRRRVLAAPLAVAGALTLGLAMAYDYGKPTGLDGRKSVWSLSRVDAQTVDRPWVAEAIEGIEKRVPESATVGVVFDRDDWDYPLYGPNLTRRLVYLPPGPAGLALAEGRGLRWIVYGENQPVPSLAQPWRAIGFGTSGWTLVERPS
jgi:glycosyl transferase family 87